MNILKKIFTFVVGIILLPLVIPMTKSFYGQITNISIIDSRSHLYFSWGAVSYVIMHLFFFKPHYVYNLGHEVVHVLSTWLSLGRARNVKVSGEEGRVQTTRSNFFINISPYFLPIYTIILCVSYFLLSKFTDAPNYSAYFIFFIGFTFSMHIIMTVEALRTSQPDLIKTGYLFSLSLIYVFNVLVAGLVISLIFTGFSFVDMMMQFFIETKELYIFIFRQLFLV